MKNIRSKNEVAVRQIIIMRILIILIFFLSFLNHTLSAEEKAGHIVRGIPTEGSCMIVDMTPEQCQLIAKQRARAEAIEQAAGMKITSQKLVTNDRLALDFIRTYSTAYVIDSRNEKWDSISHQPDRSKPPVYEHRVSLTSDIYVPAQRTKKLGLDAAINRTVFRDGESAKVNIRVNRKSKVAVFNITADDKVSMLLPCEKARENIVEQGETFEFPSEKSCFNIVMHTLPGHKKDAEAVFIVALEADNPYDFMYNFKPETPMELNYFFNKYSQIADYAEDAIITYEVVKDGGNQQ
jgi:hypothetical protein